MARTIERPRTGVVVAEPPIVETPGQELPIPVPPRQRRIHRGSLIGRIATAGQIAAAALFGVGVYQSGVVQEFLRTRENNIQQREALVSRSLRPLPGQEASWWMELPEERIRQLAQFPEINQIGDKYISTVSPALQAKAQQAGYKLIYQGDPGDTVGRTVIASGRQVDEKDWTTEDLGFGRAGIKIRGLFKAWVPNPNDPNQKDIVYALLQDPVTKKEFTVAVQLFMFDPNQFDPRPTWFIVDDLNRGPEYLGERSVIAGYPLSSDLVPTPDDHPNVKSKKLTDFPTFNDLLREKGLELTNLVQPGDYVIARMQVAEVDEQSRQNKYRLDELGAGRSISITVRRFGGLEQWQSEVVQ